MNRSRASLFALYMARSGGGPIRRTGACDEDVYEASGAGLPTEQSSGVEDADEGTNEVVGVCVRAEITAGDGATNGGYEGGVDERTGAFEEACGTAGDGIHCWDDEALCSHMVNEEKHPGAERFERRHGSGKALFGRRELFDFAAVNGSDKVIASWEVTIEGGVANAGSACDVIEARRSSIAGEDLLGHVKDALTVALRVGAGFAGRRR